MTRVLHASRLASLSLVVASLVVLVGESDFGESGSLPRTMLEAVRGASKYKLFLGKQSCDQFNAGVLSQQDGPPGVPKGTYVADCSSNQNNSGSRCIYCSMNGGATEDVVTDSTKGAPGAIGIEETTSLSTCGELYSGHCTMVDGSLQCVDDNGTSNGACGDIHLTRHQPEDPGAGE